MEVSVDIQAEKRKLTETIDARTKAGKQKDPSEAGLERTKALIILDYIEYRLKVNGDLCKEMVEYLFNNCKDKPELLRVDFVTYKDDGHLKLLQEAVSKVRNQIESGQAFVPMKIEDSDDESN